MAAHVKTTPRRLCLRPLIFNTVNVVPRLVEHNDAPAAKDCRGVACERLISTKDIPIGAITPVRARNVDSIKLAFIARKSVESPPS